MHRPVAVGETEECKKLEAAWQSALKEVVYRKVALADALQGHSRWSNISELKAQYETKQAADKSAEAWRSFFNKGCASRMTDETAKKHASRVMDKDQRLVSTRKQAWSVVMDAIRAKDQNAGKRKTKRKTKRGNRKTKRKTKKKSRKKSRKHSRKRKHSRNRYEASLL